MEYSPLFRKNVDVVEIERKSVLKISDETHEISRTSLEDFSTDDRHRSLMIEQSEVGQGESRGRRRRRPRFDPSDEESGESMETKNSEGEVASMGRRRRRPRFDPTQGEDESMRATGNFESDEASGRGKRRRRRENLIGSPETLLSSSNSISRQEGFVDVFSNRKTDEDIEVKEVERKAKLVEAKVESQAVAPVPRAGPDSSLPVFLKFHKVVPI